MAGSGKDERLGLFGAQISLTLLQAEEVLCRIIISLLKGIVSRGLFAALFCPDVASDLDQELGDMGLVKRGWLVEGDAQRIIRCIPGPEFPFQYCFNHPYKSFSGGEHQRASPR